MLPADVFAAIKPRWRRRLLANVDVSFDGCWNWKSGIARDGYAHVMVNRRLYLAHRLVYMLAVGPLMRGLEIDHLCRNRRCVCPSHLEQVTPRINVLRSNNTAAHHAKQTNCINGHPFDVANTYINPKGQRNCRRCRVVRNRAYIERKRLELRRAATGGTVQ